MRRLILLACAVLGFGIPGLAIGGIEPSPFHLVFVNRSDLIDASSGLHGQAMTDLVLYLEVVRSVSDTGAPITEVRTIQLSSAANTGRVIPAGETVVFSIDPGAYQISGSILSWWIGAKMGVEPTPWRVYALDKGTSPAEEPVASPRLPATLLSPAFDLYAFASPGTLVGNVTMSTDEIYSNCPVVPAVTAWKNHGQYVRCVALLIGDLTSLGVLTEDEADGVVSAAARSAVGK